MLILPYDITMLMYGKPKFHTEIVAYCIHLYLTNLSAVNVKSNGNMTSLVDVRASLCRPHASMHPNIYPSIHISILIYIHYPCMHISI